MAVEAVEEEREEGFTVRLFVEGFSAVGKIAVRAEGFLFEVVHLGGEIEEALCPQEETVDGTCARFCEGHGGSKRGFVSAQAGGFAAVAALHGEAPFVRQSF